ncbi:MAG: hypothetical protein ABI672_15120 [Vicinamibacteria bacterium]
MSEKMADEAVRDTYEMFIQNEDYLLSNPGDNACSNYYVSHWPAIHENVKRAPALLDGGRIRRLYFHLQRKALLPGKEIEKHYAEWEAAYREQMPLIGTTYRNTNMNRMQGLMVYGFDQLVELDRNDGFSDYALFRGVWKTYSAFSRALNMLGKPARLIGFSENEKITDRLCNLLRTIKFCPVDGWHPEMKDNEVDLEIYSQAFWGSIFTLLLCSSPKASQLINEFKDCENLPHRSVMMRFLTEFETAARNSSRGSSS